MTFFWNSGAIEPYVASQSGSTRIDLSNELSYASNGDRMPKLRPREIDVPIYPNGAHNLVFHLLGLDFRMLRVFHCFSTINRPSTLIVIQFRTVQRHVAITSLLRDKLPTP